MRYECMIKCMIKWLVYELLPVLFSKDSRVSCRSACILRCHVPPVCSRPHSDMCTIQILDRFVTLFCRGNYVLQFRANTLRTSFQYWNVNIILTRQVHIHGILYIFQFDRDRNRARIHFSLFLFYAISIIAI